MSVGRDKSLDKSFYNNDHVSGIIGAAEQQSQSTEIQEDAQEDEGVVGGRGSCAPIVFYGKICKSFLPNPFCVQG